ncbi:MAG: hypothetical protein JWN52_1544 [Actinomycetia bacterium]|nr:hypothetical protein [Actinomycetes bacterium]
MNGRPVTPAAPSAKGSGAPEDRPTSHEVADALWLASLQLAADRQGPPAPARDRPQGDAGDRPQRHTPPDASRPESGLTPSDERRPPPEPPRRPRPTGAETGGEASRPIEPNGTAEQARFAATSWPVAPPFDDLFAGVPPLLDQRHITKALRPFKRLVDSRRGERELDEEATAERAAQDRLWLPQCRPARERWLDLDVVIDDSPFASLHRPLADTFVESIAAAGAFRMIRVHLMDTDVDEARALTLRSTAADGPSIPASSLTSFGPAGRRLILVLTDGVGDAWHAMAAQQILACWGRHCPAALVQFLPRRQWRRTGIVSHPAKLQVPSRAAPNHRYRMTNGETDDDRVCIPMLEIKPGQLADWARFVTATQKDWYGAAAFCGTTGAQQPVDPDPWDHFAQAAEPDEAELLRTPADLVCRFRAAVSPTAFELAVHLAAAPLNLPVMRLVQRTMLPGSRPADLSELVGSGLLQIVGPDQGRDINAVDKVAYDFFPGVREELLAAGRRSETTKVLITVAQYLGDRVHVLRDVHNMLMSPHQSGTPAVTPDAVLFAAPALHAFRALSGPYLRPAHDLHVALQTAVAARESHPIATQRNEQPITRSGTDVTTGPGRSPSMTTLDETRLIEDIQDIQDGADDTARHPLPPSGVGVTIRTIPPAPERRPADPPPVWGNVPPRNISFTGRGDLLDELHARLSQGTTAVLPEALHGMGGVGKSQIAIEYVYRHTQDYDLIWWIPAERPGQIQQGLAELAAQLGLKVSQEVNVAVPAVIEALRLGLPYRNWLLVFDNAEQLDEVREFFPTNGPGKILVTSRNQAWTSVASSLEVDVFAREESMQLLRLRGPEISDSDADELAEILGDLPLAIEQAAVWLAETGMQVEEYLHLFREKHDKAAELLRDAAPVAYELPVAAAWNVSLDQLRVSDPAALQLLQVCAFFAPEPISRRLLVGTRNIDGPAELMEALADPIKLGRAIRAINQYALAKISHRHNTIMLHRLVQRVLVGQMSPQEAAELRHCGHQLLAKADPNAPDLAVHWQQYADLLPHVLYSDIIDCDDAWARQLVLNEIDFLYQWGDHQGFLDLAQKAVEVWTQKLGEDHEQTLTAGLHLGRALRLQGRFSEAYERHVRVRDILAEDRGMEDERTLEAQLYVGGDLRYLGEFHQALELDQQSFEVLQRRFGRDDPITLSQAHLYAIDLRLTGDPERALEIDRDTYQRLITLFGEDHASAMGSLAGIAVDEMESGNYVEARELMRRNVQQIQDVFGSSFAGLAEGYNSLSVMERKAGDHEKALELSTLALKLFESRYGQANPGSVAAALNHAVNLRQTGKLPESIELARATIDSYQVMFGPRHPNTPTSNVNLAVALRLNGQAVEARKLDEDALAKLTEVLGPDHPRSIVCSINLASDLFALGDFQGALDLDRHTLERARDVMGEDHPTTLACALNHALDLRAVHEESEAEELLADAIARLRRVHGDGHPATLSARQGIRADCDIYPIPV